MEGRFISKDPISFAGGDIRLYGYAKNNPILSKDPFGLSAASFFLGKTAGWATGKACKNIDPAARRIAGSAMGGLFTGAVSGAEAGAIIEGVGAVPGSIAGGIAGFACWWGLATSHY